MKVFKHTMARINPNAVDHGATLEHTSELRGRNEIRAELGRLLQKLQDKVRLPLLSLVEETDAIVTIVIIR